MESICDDAIGSFNSFLGSRKESNQNSLMTVVFFDNEYEVRESAVPITSVKPLNRTSYVPRGSTALLDAIGLTIQAIEERPHENEEIMIAILTDGQENASVRYSLEQIRSLIQKKEEQDWDFVYLSADPSACTDGSAMGFHVSKMAMYDKEDIQQAYAYMNEMLATKMAKAKFIKSMKQRMQKDEDMNDKMYQ